MNRSTGRALGAIGYPFLLVIKVSLLVAAAPFILMGWCISKLAGALSRALAKRQARQPKRRRDLTRAELRNDAERAAWDRAYNAALSQAHYSNRR